MKGQPNRIEDQIIDMRCQAEVSNTSAWHQHLGSDLAGQAEVSNTSAATWQVRPRCPTPRQRPGRSGRGVQHLGSDLAGQAEVSNTSAATWQVRPRCPTPRQ
ncbi:hypothetical protein PCASD_23090 [Puccinia coronata f. sp. avenae]|uniref:Uncharacterized protein n=1 Tax=Puccinia coronata f. sp. avenae TaxID=200324 RepID=A0A2N5TPP5_9BASI|nr:hypothetical protein PCASD_23090 [Puccinia coronata f. sp. avenae]